MPLFVVNSEEDTEGRRVPVEQPPSWVGNLYQKTGNVFKFVMLTEADISGLPGVFGPVALEDLEAAVDADGGTFRGFTITDVPDWSINGIRYDGPVPIPPSDV